MADAKGNRSMPAPPVVAPVAQPVVAPPVQLPPIPLVPPVHTDAQGPAVDLAIPIEHEQHSIARVGDSNTSLSVKVPQSHSLEVIATRPGFIYNIRKVAGDRFSISDITQLGDWMILADSKLEEQRQLEIKLAKLKARS